MRNKHTGRFYVKPVYGLKLNSVPGRSKIYHRECSAAVRFIPLCAFVLSLFLGAGVSDERLVFRIPLASAAEHLRRLARCLLLSGDPRRLISW